MLYEFIEPVAHHHASVIDLVILITLYLYNNTKNHKI